MEDNRIRDLRLAQANLLDRACHNAYSLHACLQLSSVKQLVSQRGGFR